MCKVQIGERAWDFRKAKWHSVWLKRLPGARDPLSFLKGVGKPQHPFGTLFSLLGVNFIQRGLLTSRAYVKCFVVCMPLLPQPPLQDSLKSHSLSCKETSCWHLLLSASWGKGGDTKKGKKKDSFSAHHRCLMLQSLRALTAFPSSHSFWEL